MRPGDNIEATEVLELLQLPPLVAEFRNVVEPTHTFGVPEIGAGIGLTVNTADLKQPVGTT